jgi:hypothetical protein
MRNFSFKIFPAGYRDEGISPLAADWKKDPDYIKPIYLGTVLTIIIMKNFK